MFFARLVEISFLLAHIDTVKYTSFEAGDSSYSAKAQGHKNYVAQRQVKQKL